MPRLRTPPPVVLAAGTVDGAGTMVALRAVLRSRPPAGAVAIVPQAFAAEAEQHGWTAKTASRWRAVAAELVGWGGGGVWIGFCDRLPLMGRRSRQGVLVVQNPHLYGAPATDGSWAQRVRLAVLRRWARASARRAQLVICSTASSADEVIAATGAAANNVRVEPIPAIDVHERKAAHASHIGRVLVVGDVYGYKRLEVAVDAVTDFATRHDRDVEVVHIGMDKDAAARATLDRAVARARAHGVRVEEHGRVPHATVLAEMTRADVLLLTSTSETQGLPLVEAHAVGLPVVARAIGPFVDLGGDATAMTPVDADASVFSRALDELDARSAREQAAARGMALHPAADHWPLLDHLRGLASAHS